MKSSALFLIFTLLVSTFATTTNIASLESSKFGKNVLDLIQIHLDSKEPVQVLLKMLNDMADELKAQQDSDDKAHETFQSACSDDITHYNNEITEAKNAIEKSTNSLAQLRPELTTTEDSLSKEESNLKALQEQLDQAKSQRAVEATEFETKVQEHEAAVSTLHQVSGLFQQLLATPGTSFLEKRNTVLAQISSTITNNIKKVRKGFQGIFKILAQIVSKAPVQANQELVNKILSLVAKIKENVESSYETEKKAEEERINAFNEVRSKLEASIVESQSAINGYNSKIASLKASIANEEDVIDANTKKKDNNEVFLADRTKVCNAENDAYSAARTKRTDERNVVAQAIDIVTTRLVPLKSYLKERVAHVA